MRATDNTILITGGTSGIGLGFAKKFYELGNKVIICGRRKDRLAEISKQYPGIETRICDVSSAQQRRELVHWAIQNYPKLNILMNNAGIQLSADLTHEIDLDKVQQEIEINLVAPIHLSSLLAEQLTTKQDAAIINIPSGLAFAPISFMPVYCATKAAIHSFTLSLRHQLKNTNVKVFEIAPPSTDTELGAERRQDKSQTHGGMPIGDFISEALTAIKDNRLETAIGAAANMREQREKLFTTLNP